MNHYEWLDRNFVSFLQKLNVPNAEHYQGLITAHGDKCYGYKKAWNEHGLHFYHGVAIYLLTYIDPYDMQVRDTQNGWIDPCDWIIANKNKLLPFLNKIEDEK